MATESTASEESTSPWPASSVIRCRSSNTASTTTCAESPSYDKALVSSETSSVSGSNGAAEALSPPGFRTAEYPCTRWTSSVATWTGVSSTTTEVEPSLAPLPPTTTISALPADLPTTVSPSIMPTIVLETPSAACSRPAILFDTSASKMVPWSTFWPLLPPVAPRASPVLKVALA